MTEPMKRSLDRGLSRLGALALSGLALCAFALAPAPASARDFVEANIVLDLGSDEFNAEFVTAGGSSPLTSPRQIVDGAFTRLDLKVKLPNREAEDRLQRKVDESYEPEDSGCRAGVYSSLTMEDGLRYFFEVDVPSTENQDQIEKVSAVIFPGNRSDHFANDVFCEFDEALGDQGSVFHLTGFYYVIHRRTAAGWDVQLRAVRLTDEEIAQNF